MNARLLLTLSAAALAGGAQAEKKLPNVIYIMADDLGIGDLGCYGQTRIKTPAIDAIAANGLRFTNHYSGSTVSAPSRCVLMTGKHTGHAAIRGNIGAKGADGENYDGALPQGEVSVAEVLKRKDYRTACVGKWGLGGPGSEGHPNRHGFDYFFGYLSQLAAHSYYPSCLFENETKVMLDRKVYSHDLMMDKALEFIAKDNGSPFFLYLSPTIPHAELIVPEGELGDYDGRFEEKPYAGGHYCAQPKPRATFAAMVSRLDRDVARIVALLKEKGLYDNTIIVFTSDNGTHMEGGHDPRYFNSNGGFRGAKRDMYGGGIRTPFVVQWPAAIPAGSGDRDHVSAFWDFMPTLCELVGEKAPAGTDGISYLPVLTGKGKQKKHDYLYWEFHEMGGKQAVLQDNWKLIRLQVNKPAKTHYELYNLAADPVEEHNLAASEPRRVEQLRKVMDKARTTNPRFSFAFEKQVKEGNKK